MEQRERTLLAEIDRQRRDMDRLARKSVSLFLKNLYFVSVRSHGSDAQRTRERSKMMKF
jgi:hypothetical protein